MMERFVHGRVIFAGDAAHVVSPFGARGGNARRRRRRQSRLEAGAGGRRQRRRPRCSTAIAASAARRRARTSCNSTRSTDFITPKFAASRAFRDATLALARDFPFARALINSGRLSVPTPQPASPIDTPDRDDDWVGGPATGPRDARRAARQRLAGRSPRPRFHPADLRTRTASTVAGRRERRCRSPAKGWRGKRYDARPGHDLSDPAGSLCRGALATATILAPWPRRSTARRLQEPRMTALRRTLNLAQPDDVYNAIVDAHKGLERRAVPRPSTRG